MKISSLLVLCLVLSAYRSQAQEKDEFKLSQHTVPGGYKNFEIVGTESASFVDALFSRFPTTKRKGYIWKFKDVKIAGIDKPLTLKVHQGLFGLSEDCTTPCGRSYFTTFTSEKYKQSRLKNIRETEQAAILIYIKRGRHYVLETSEEAELVKSFLLSVRNSAK